MYAYVYVPYSMHTLPTVYAHIEQYAYSTGLNCTIVLLFCKKNYYYKLYDFLWYPGTFTLYFST